MTDVMNAMKSELQETKRDLVDLREQNETLIAENEQLRRDMDELRGLIRELIKESEPLPQKLWRRFTEHGFDEE